MRHAATKPVTPQPDDVHLKPSAKHARKKHRTRHSHHESRTSVIVAVAFIIIVVTALMIFLHGRDKALLAEGLRHYHGASAVTATGELRHQESGRAEQFIVERSLDSLYVKNLTTQIEMVIVPGGTVYVRPDISTSESIEKAVEASNPAEALRLLQTEAIIASLPPESWLKLTLQGDDAPVMDASSSLDAQCLSAVAEFDNYLDKDAVDKLTAQSYIVENTREFSRFETKLAAAELGFEGCFTDGSAALSFQVDKMTKQIESMRIALPDVTFELTLAYDQPPTQGVPAAAYDQQSLSDTARRQAGAIERRVRERLDAFPVLRNLLLELVADEREREAAAN